MLTSGRIINRYRIEELLGQGGFGAVYRAQHIHLGTKVAIKETFSASPDQFVREAQLLASLRHPTLPKVTDYFEEAQRYYLVMEYIEGENLDIYVAHQPKHRLSETKALHLIVPILDAVEYLHNQTPPILHRDIKPNNIRITPAGEIYLVDFGLAKPYDPASTSTITPPAITSGFSPLEQYTGNTDQRSDLYALGATIYYILTGTKPPDAPTRAEHDTLVPLRRLNPFVSITFEEIVNRLLAIHPANRYQQIEHVRHDLARLTGTEQTVFPRMSMWKLGTIFGIIFAIILSVGTFVALYSVIGQKKQPTSPPITSSVPEPTVNQSETAVSTTLIGDCTTEGVQTAATRTSSWPTIYTIPQGKLLHSDVAQISGNLTDLYLQNFAIEAVFTNPYDQQQFPGAYWDYGFQFRLVDVQNQYLLYLRSNGDWWLRLRKGSLDAQTIDYGRVQNINSSANQSNTLHLIVNGNKGLFFVNNSCIKELNLSALMTTGNIAVGTGLQQGDQIQGQITNYQNVTLKAPADIARKIAPTSTALVVAQTAQIVQAQTAAIQARNAEIATSQALTQTQKLYEDSNIWGEVLIDTFDDPANPKQWLTNPPGKPFVDKSLTQTLDLSGGFYRWVIDAIQDDGRILAAPAEITTDFRLSVTIQPDTNSQFRRVYGVMFRQQKQNGKTHYYEFRINEFDQQYQFRVFDQTDKWKYIKGWTTNQNIKVHEANELTVIAQGSAFWLYINGKPVDGSPFQDNTISTGGKVGMTIDFLRGDKIVFAYDGFTLRKKPGS